jgi:hypothetical protein
MILGIECMDKNRVYYKRIVSSMIKKSFPNLSKKKIIVIEFNSKKYSGGAYKVPFVLFIFINKNLRNYKKKAIGVLAHELSHLETFEKKGWIRYIIEGILYWISPKKRAEVDKETDKLAIRKGYAKELYIFKNYKKKNNLDKYYLSSKEIKSYAKRIGKW